MPTFWPHIIFELGGVSKLHPFFLVKIIGQKLNISFSEGYQKMPLSQNFEKMSAAVFALLYSVQQEIFY